VLFAPPATTRCDGNGVDCKARERLVRRGKKTVCAFFWPRGQAWSKLWAAAGENAPGPRGRGSFILYRRRSPGARSEFLERRGLLSGSSAASSASLAALMTVLPSTAAASAADATDVGQVGQLQTGAAGVSFTVGQLTTLDRNTPPHGAHSIPRHTFDHAKNGVSQPSPKAQQP